MNKYNEDAYEQQCITWFKNIGWNWVNGPEIAHDGHSPERQSHKDVVLVSRLEDALLRINPGVPSEAFSKVVKLLISPGEKDILKANSIIQGWFVDGIPVKARGLEGD